MSKLLKGALQLFDCVRSSSTYCKCQNPPSSMPRLIVWHDIMSFLDTQESFRVYCYFYTAWLWRQLTLVNA